MSVWPFLRKRLGRFISNSGVRVRLSTPPGVDAHAMARQIAKELEHIFVVIRVDSPSRWPGQLDQQYGVLSRQGLVLEIGEDSSQKEVTLTAASGRQLLQALASFPAEERTERLAVWIVERWAESLRCS